MPRFLDTIGQWSESASALIEGPDGKILSVTLSTDHATAIITREQWESERQRREVWRGPEDGLPPIGAKVLTRYGKAQVIALSRTGENVCIEWEDGEIGVIMTAGLRSIQSDRELAIDAIRTFSGDKVTAEIAGLMYDNGFRLK
jgi:hypothetical protein